jgi:LysM repeat protein
MRTRRLSFLARSMPTAIILALAACSHASHGPAPVSAAPATASPDSVIAALNAGDEATARKQIKALQKRTPNDPAARVLEESIDRDPVDLLGPKSFSYTTQPGDTMVGLADRFLGNRLKFYQLARYNGVKIPATLAAGTVLKIPGTPPKPVAPKPAPRPAEPAAPAVKPAHAKPAPAPAVTPAAPTANPALARQLRGAGLAALNQGKVDRAVALLGRAAALDPGNPLIARDLSRAQRIARTVQTHH